MNQVDSKTNISRNKVALELLQNETRLGMILSLMVYKSLNLRKLALIANIKEPSAYEHVKSLLKENTIELDSEKANKRGKYYKLTDNAVKSLEAMDEIDLKGAKEDLKANLPLFTAGIRTPTIITKNFVTYLSEYMMSKDLDNQNDINELKGLIDHLYGSFQMLEIKQKDQIPRIKELFNNLSKEISKISEEESTNEDQVIEERYLIYTFAIPLNAINPNNE